MKLAKVKIEYTCGLTLLEHVVLDVKSGEIHLPPRLVSLMENMDDSECSPAFSLEYKGRFLLVTASANGLYRVDVPMASGSVVKRLLHSITYPTRDQSQQNGRFLHTLSAASIGGAAATWHASGTSGLSALSLPVPLAIAGVLLWYVGFLCMNGEQ